MTAAVHPQFTFLHRQSLAIQPIFNVLKSASFKLGRQEVSIISVITVTTVNLLIVYLLRYQ